ncbi:GIY-YIG nuclease family protein [Caulobacter sp. ErkDOM-E]|uniref:GIY-YIG nuclease family protein n=1 Tax=Caulobacter sp. ErkDOM-E TaxID=3402778 RepID=UPI003AF5539C
MYVLVNSSLPGLVKVGKTSRSTSERVKELSNATGVPTPFIVAFEREFEDCDAAERFVHKQLEAAGLRQAANREFFRAPTSQVVRVVIDAPDSLESYRSAYDVDAPAENISSDNDLLNAYDIESEIISEASDYLQGQNGRLKDPAEAIRLFKIAAKQGSGFAHFALGVFAQEGRFAPENADIAKIHYLSAIRLNDFRSYPRLGRIYQTKLDTKNANKCAEIFVQKTNEYDFKYGDYSIEEYDFDLYYFILTTTLSYGGIGQFHASVQQALKVRAHEILKHIETEHPPKQTGNLPPVLTQMRKDINSAAKWLEASARENERASQALERGGMLE